MLYKVKKMRVCPEDYLKKIIGKNVNKEQLLLANKVISINTKEDERRLYISRCKELVYKLDRGAYLTLSDISHLNRVFVTLGLNHKFDIEQYERFVDTRNIVTFAGDLDLESEQEDFMYVSYIQNPLEYGISVSDIEYQDLEAYLDSINKFIYRKTNKVFNNGTIDKRDVSDDMIITSSHGCYNILDDLNKTSFDNSELSKQYAYKFRH